MNKTNTLYASAVDLNTGGQIATAQVSLGNYFSPPPNGNYVFGIGGEARPPWITLIGGAWFS